MCSLKGDATSSEALELCARIYFRMELYELAFKGFTRALQLLGGPIGSEKRLALEAEIRKTEKFVDLGVKYYQLLGTSVISCKGWKVLKIWSQVWNVNALLLI